MSGIIIIPRLAKPVIDRTDFKDGRVIFLLIFEAKPLWLSGTMPGRMYDLDEFEGWVAFEQSPKKNDGVINRRGIFFPLRKDAVACAENIISNLARQIFRAR